MVELTLYDWQKRAIDFFKDNKGIAIYTVTTGAGKTKLTTQLIKYMIEQDPNVRILIIVPKNVILETTWFKELYNAGISLKDIGTFYGKVKEYAKITITNMQSLSKVPLELFQAVVYDELHNCTLNQVRIIFNHPFKYKIGLTATLQRQNNEHFEIMKMFDYNIFNYSPKEAIDDGILNPFNFTDIPVDLDPEDREIYEELNEKIKSMSRIRDKLPKESKIQFLAMLGQRKKLVNNYYKKFEEIAKICKKHQGDKIIIFNEYNSQTNKLYWYLIEQGITGCSIIHSTMNQEKREKNLMDFMNDKYNIVLATKSLDEGFNLPRIDTAIISAGNSTKKQSIQRMGRVLRKKKKTSDLYQIYVDDTIEKKWAKERTEFFKPLASSYTLVSRE